VNRTIQIVVSVVITVGALWYSLSGVELGSFLDDLGHARLIWLVPMAACAVLALWLRAVRWKLLLGTLGPLGDTPVFHATNIGFLGNMVLPLRAGEVIKPVVVGRAGRISTPAAFATVGLERFCDLVMLGAFAVLTVFLVPQADFARAWANSIVVFLGVALLAVVVIIRSAGWLEARLDAIADRLPAFAGRIVREIGRGVLHGLRGLSDFRVLLPVILYSALVWLVAVAGFVAGALALEIDAPLVPLGFAVTVAVAVAVSLPSAPGFIGVFWAGSKAALALFGVPDTMGFTYGVLNWIVQLVVIVALGLWSMSRLHLSFGDVRSAASTSEAA
jgi:uncharacterized protein (TIRG00374 family)